MYFSTNSRYVLHRTQWMTPSTYLLKGAERLFSIKFPHDDPSKPALRVNIPKDSPSSSSEKRPKLIHSRNIAEPRSKSLVSFNPTAKDGFLARSESESQLQLEDMTEVFELHESDTANATTAISTAAVDKASVSKLGQKNDSAAAKDDDYQEGLSTPLHDEETGEALANSYANSSSLSDSASSAVGDVESPVAAKAEASGRSESQQQSDDRMLYIIVDSPDEKEERKQYKNEEANASPPQEAVASAPKEHKTSPAPKPPHFKSERQKSETWWSKKSKSLSKLPMFKNDTRRSSSRMDVHEIEDVATHVFHSKQKQGKFYGLECVPEKEFTTRSDSCTYHDVPIKLSFGNSSRTFRGISGEIASVEDLPEFSKPLDKKKFKVRNSDSWTHRGEKSRSTRRSSYNAPFPTQPAVDRSKGHMRSSALDYSGREDDFLKLRDSPGASAAEKRKGLAAQVKESTGLAGKSGAKAVPVKMPEKVTEAKVTEEKAPEEPAAPPAAAAENESEAETAASSYPSVGEKTENNLTKVENEPISIRVAQNEYYSPWKDNSSNYPDAPEVSADSFVPPKHEPSEEIPRKKIYQRKPLRTRNKAGKYADSEDSPELIEEPKTPESDKTEKTESDFQPSPSYVSIGCDKIPAPPMKFSAAFPPLLCEALKIRGRILGFRREFLFNDKWMGKLECLGKHLDKGSKSSSSSQKSKMDLSENSILFPRGDAEKFDCPLFGKKEEISMNLSEPKPEKTVKISDNMANVANEGLTEIKGRASVDSLDMMKKVKKLVDLELDNAIKIFKVDPQPETSSVVMSEGDSWKVDTETLEKIVSFGTESPTAEDNLRYVKKTVSKRFILGDERNNLKIQDLPSKAPMYLPSKKESSDEMKLSGQTNSVMTFNPQTSEFFVNKEALLEAIRRSTGEFFDDIVIQSLKGELRKGGINNSIVAFGAKDKLTYAMRSGDSILVFDEETQSWKVDYSILEKREEQHRIEEELMKRSELILETFEKLEKGQMTKVPGPGTKEKRIFDYGKKEWKSYPTDKKPTEKSSKEKYPFKEYNAEEIRRSNSDLYENLFVGSKKDTTMNKNNNNSRSGKGSKSCSSAGKKMASSGSSMKDSGTTKERDSSKQESQLPPAVDKTTEDKAPAKEDDNYWESFLKMNILPRDISEIRPPPPPPPPPAPPKSQPPKPSPLQPPKTEAPKPSIPTPKIDNPKPGVPPPKIESPKSNIPPKNIDEPRFKIFIPFIGDKKPEAPKVKDPPKETPVVEDPKKIPPAPTAEGITPPKEGPKVEDPKKKPPTPTAGGIVPPKEAPKVDDPKKTPPIPTAGGIAPPKEGPKVEDPKKIPPAPTAGGIAPPKEGPKVEDPKKTPPIPTAGGIAPPKEAPKVEDPKKKPPAPTAGGIAPPKEAPKVEDPKKKVPPPSAGGASKDEDTVKAPPKEAPKVEDPKPKPSQPTIGSATKQDVKIKTPEKELPKVEDPKQKPPEPTSGGVTKQDTKIIAPAKESPKVEDPKKKPSEPALGGVVKEDVKTKLPPAKEASKVEEPKKQPPEAPPTGSGDIKSQASPYTSYHEDPRKNKVPPTIGASYSPTKVETFAPPACPSTKIEDPKSSPGGKKEKSAADHYISENIVEISRNTSKELPTKFKTNKIETVKVNISSEKRMPSKVTEINLNRKCDEKGKESSTALKKSQNANDPKKPGDATSKKDKSVVENKTFYKNFEKYKTPFSDPEYEEKSMKIKSDIESNPNLKKLDNWNKTLVLHDIGKPPENIETWLKDETDKMATLLLKVLQEAADGKPRKKQPLVKCKPGDKPASKGTPFDTTPKKCETTPESFLFRVRTVNVALENDKKVKPLEDRKPTPHPKPTSKDALGQMDKPERPYKVIDTTKILGKEASHLNIPAPVKNERVSTCTEVQKPKLSQTALESVEPAAVSEDIAYQNISPIEITDEVPGPEFLKKLSNTWKLFPIIGSQMTIMTLLRAYQLVNLKNFFGSGSVEKNRNNAFARLFMKYGPIVNVQGPLSGNVIIIHKPEHFVSVFEQDAFFTVRSVFDSLDQSRRESEDKVLTAAISTDWSKPEWNDLRKGTNDPILKGSEKFLDSAEVAGDSLISSIRKSRNLQNYVSDDFIDEIKRWSLEGICGILFDKSFGFLDRKNTNMSWVMEPDKLFMAVEEASNYLSKCEKGFQVWRLMTTTSYVGLGQSYRSLTSILSKQLYQAEINLKNKYEFIKEQSPFLMEDLTFLEGMLLNDGLTTDEIICNLIDILLIGTNTMTSALAFLLYNLSQNARVQNKLLKELKAALPGKNSRLDYHSLNSLKYLQACLKESLRLHIPIPLFSRMLQNDILLSNYIIPKGSYVVMDYRVTCLREQIFDDPEKFMPERWLTEEKWMKDLHPYDTFPLCQGPRAELAKKVVDLQVLACAAKVIRNFGIEYHYGDIYGGANTLISMPGKPLKLSFVERDS